MTGSSYCSCKITGSYCFSNSNKCQGLLDGKEINCNDTPDCIKLLSIKPYFRQCYLCFENSRFIYIGTMYEYFNGLILSPPDSTHKTSFCINSDNETIKSGDKITFTETIPTYPENKYLNYDGYNIIFNDTATIFVIKKVDGNIGDCITPTTQFYLYMVDKTGSEFRLGYRDIDDKSPIKDSIPVTSENIHTSEFFRPIILTLRAV
jgi:hypothetical protein